MFSAMGSSCWKKSAVQRTASEITLGNGIGEQNLVFAESSEDVQRTCKLMAFPEPVKKKQINEESMPYVVDGDLQNGETSVKGKISGDCSKEPKTNDDSLMNVNNKVPEVTSGLRRGCAAGFQKILDVLDALGSSMTSLNSGQRFGSEITTKNDILAILAFEVANTIVKGSDLMRSLSKENIKYLKEVVLPSEGVQRLVSTDMNELLRIAAADKREDLKVFSDEVVRFGNRCKDPQWHNLDRYFAKLQFDFLPQKHLKETTPGVMRNLMSLVHNTSILYHELHALDRFEQDYKRKLREESLSLVVQRGDNLQIIKQELKNHRKHVEKLKKKSLWSENLEEIMSKLVDIVHFLHLEIHDNFGTADGEKPLEKANQRLGSAGLSLHYANIVNQIDIIVSRSSSVPPNMRDALYQGLPPRVKSALRSRLQTFENKEEIQSHLAANQVKAEMDKTLIWLVPLAINTARAHQGFGWVGEWAKSGNEAQRKTAGQFDVIKIGTLCHADKESTEAYILDLVIWLHLLISQCRPTSGGSRSPVRSPMHSPPHNKTTDSKDGAINSSSKLNKEDQQILRDVSPSKVVPGISKSHEINNVNPSSSKHERLSPSRAHENTKQFKSKRRQLVNPTVDPDIDRINN